MKVAIVGAGHIGTTVAYTLLTKGLVTEIALVNRTRDKAYGEALDMTHALAAASRSVKIYSGDYRACAGAKIVVVTAGAATVKGQSRLEIVERNAAVYRQIIPQIVEHDPEAIVLVVTNPVDVTTALALRYSGLTPARVFGSGTVLDGQRLESLLGRHFDVHPGNVCALVVGEHGDSMVPVWSRASISGIPLQDFPEYDREEMDDIFDMTRRGAAMVRATKDSTQFATSASICRILEAILLDKKEVLTVSTLVEEYGGAEGVCLSMPAVVGARGVERVLDLRLADDEHERLLVSAEILRALLRGMGGVAPQA